MLPDQWRLGLLLAAVAAHALLAARAARSGAASGGGADARVDREAGVVACPDCGAENELGYRYCRECVTELPLSTGFDRDAGGALGRFAG